MKKHPIQPQPLKRIAMLDELTSIRNEARAKGQDFPDFDFSALSDIVLAELLRFARRLKKLWDNLRDKEDQPKPKPPIVPLPQAGRAEIITVGDHRELRIDGDRALGVGRYEMLVDAIKYPDAQAVRTELSQWRDAGANFVRIFGLCAFEIDNRPTLTAPWADHNGRYQLDTVNQHFYARAYMIAEVAHSLGMQIVWAVFDGWSLRKRYPWWACNPLLHEDSRQADGNLDGDYRLFQKCCYESGEETVLSRRLWECVRRDEGYIPLHGFVHPAQWVILRELAAVAKQFGHEISFWNEMNTRTEKLTADVPMMRLWLEHAKAHLADVHPHALTSLSTNVHGLFADVDIADVHALTHVGDADGLNLCFDGAAAELRRINHRAVYRVNSDSCMSLPRFEALWVKAVALEAWRVGGHAEFKAGYPEAYPGVLEGIRQARAQG